MQHIVLVQIVLSGLQLDAVLGAHTTKQAESLRLLPVKAKSKRYAHRLLAPQTQRVVEVTLHVLFDADPHRVRLSVTPPSNTHRQT